MTIRLIHDLGENFRAADHKNFFKPIADLVQVIENPVQRIFLENTRRGDGIFISGQNDVNAIRQRTESLGKRLPSLSSHNNRIHLIFVFGPAGEFLEMFKILRQMPREVSILSNPAFQVHSNDDIERNIHLDGYGKFNKGIVLISSKLNIFESQIEQLFIRDFDLRKRFGLSGELRLEAIDVI